MDTYGDATGLTPVMGLAEKLGVEMVTIYQLVKAGKIQLYRGLRRRRGDLEWDLVDVKQAVAALVPR